MSKLQSDQSSSFNIAIVGGGPKAIFALESLVSGALFGKAPDPTNYLASLGVDGFEDAAPELFDSNAPGADECTPWTKMPNWAQIEPTRSMKITIFEPGEVGEGMAFQRTLPLFMRFNTRARIVDPWTNSEWEKPWTYDEWVERGGLEEARAHYDAEVWAKYEDVIHSKFPPRAIVGEYNKWVYSEILRQTPPSIIIEQVREKVEDIDDVHERFDQVLLATGHAPDIGNVTASRNALGNDWQADVPLVSRVYPTDQLDAIAPGARVAIRGAALTMIDAVLTLTEGRGGRFVPAEGAEENKSEGDTREDGDLELRYEPSGNEPSVILPASRSGQFMWPKPLTNVAEGDREIINKHLRELNELGVYCQLDELFGHLEGCAADLLIAQGWDEADAHDDFKEWLEDGWDRCPNTRYGEVNKPWEAPVGVPGNSRSREHLRSGIDQTLGLAKRGPAWAGARAWAGMDPRMIDFVSLGKSDEWRWQRWWKRVGHLESLSFGPPMVNARKILALLDAGILSGNWMDEVVAITTRGASAEDGTDLNDEIDVVVDAVLAPAGVRDAINPVTDTALEAGEITMYEGQRGMAVTADARAVKKNGEASTWLSAVGRPTADQLMNNDTLNRAMHPLPQRWARRMLNLWLEVEPQV